MTRMGLLPDRKVVPLRRRAKHARHAPWQAAVDRLEVRVAEVESAVADARALRHLVMQPR